MARTRPPYPPEFRREAIRLLRAGDRSPKQLAVELGCTEQTLRNWLRQDEADRGERSDVLSSDERRRLRELERENRVRSARSGRSSSGLRLSSPGRPRGRDEVSVRGGGACTVSCLGRHSAADTRRARPRCLSRPRRSTATTGTSLNAVSTPAIAGVRTLYGLRVASLRATVASGEHRSRFGRRVPPRCGVLPEPPQSRPGRLPARAARTQRRPPTPRQRAARRRTPSSS